MTEAGLLDPYLDGERFVPNVYWMPGFCDNKDILKSSMGDSIHIARRRSGKWSLAATGHHAQIGPSFETLSEAVAYYRLCLASGVVPE